MGYSERLKKWSCENCKNLKRKTVTKKDLEGISKRDLLKAKSMLAYGSLGLKFLITYGLYVKINRITKDKGCVIYYCKKDLFKRRAYELKDNFVDNSVINRKRKCRKYNSE
jgi:hypothetical protein